MGKSEGGDEVLKDATLAARDIKRISQHSGLLTHGRLSGYFTKEVEGDRCEIYAWIRACRLGFPPSPPHDGLAGLILG